MKKQPDSNIEMLVDYMEWGSPMNQMFVIDAVSKQAKLVVDNEEQVLKDMEDGFIYGPSWVRAAKDFIEASDKFYNRHG